MKQVSWKKITVTLLYMVLTMLGSNAHPGAMDSAQFTASVTGMVVSGLAAMVYIVTQGRVDLAKVQSVASNVADAVKTAVETLTSPATGGEAVK